MRNAITETRLAHPPPDAAGGPVSPFETDATFSPERPFPVETAPISPAELADAADFDVRPDFDAEPDLVDLATTADPADLVGPAADGLDGWDVADLLNRLDPVWQRLADSELAVAGVSFLAGVCSMLGARYGYRAAVTRYRAHKENREALAGVPKYLVTAFKEEGERNRRQADEELEARMAAERERTRVEIEMLNARQAASERDSEAMRRAIIDLQTQADAAATGRIHEGNFGDINCERAREELRENQMVADWVRRGFATKCSLIDAIRAAEPGVDYMPQALKVKAEAIELKKCWDGTVLLQTEDHDGLSTAIKDFYKVLRTETNNPRTFDQRDTKTSLRKWLDVTLEALKTAERETLDRVRRPPGSGSAAGLRVPAPAGPAGGPAGAVTLAVPVADAGLADEGDEPETPDFLSGGDLDDKLDQIDDWLEEVFDAAAPAAPGPPPR